MASHPRAGRILLAIVDDPASTKVWPQGADGERAVAETLDALPDCLPLHDRRMRRADGRLGQTNLDHIAVAPSGIWVIDAKTHKGRLEVRRTGGLFSPRVEQLRIGGRDQSRLVDGVAKQVDAVRSTFVRLGEEVDVFGAMCFVGTDLPWIDESIAGVALRGRGGMSKLLRRPGPLDEARRLRLHRMLAETFPAY